MYGGPLTLIKKCFQLSLVVHMPMSGDNYVSVCDSIHGHTSITNAVRSSEYFQSIPPLSAECLELDGDASTLPVIFEDVYAEQVIKSLSTGAGTASSQPQDSSVDLRRLATDNSQVSCSSQVPASSRQSRLSLASTVSSGSDFGRKTGKLRLRPIRSETLRRGGESLVASDEPDCTLVGYRKVDISCKEFRPTVELGTLTTPSALAHQSLVGSGVVMQPSLLFNAVSLPALHTTTATATANDVSVSLTGSMPTLVDNSTSSSGVELTPYWRSQQGKAQLVAQHSNEATAAVTDGRACFDSDAIVPASDSSSVDFNLDSDQDTPVGLDLDRTVGNDLQRAVGNDLYMAEGVDLDTTLGDELLAIGDVKIETNKTSSAAECDSRQQSDDNSAAADAAAEHQTVLVSAEAAVSDVDKVDNNMATGSSLTASEHCTLASVMERQELACVDGSSADALPVPSDKNTTTDVISTDVNAADSLSITDCLSSSAEAASSILPASSSVAHVDNGTESAVAVTAEPNIIVSCDQSNMDMKPPSEDKSTRNLNSDESTGVMNSAKAADDVHLEEATSSVVLDESAHVVSLDEPVTESNVDSKQSTPDSLHSNVNEVTSSHSVGDVADELSVVIPSSNDSLSDDERYLSGQCTLLELLGEGSHPGAMSAGQRQRLFGCSVVSSVVAQQLSGATLQQRVEDMTDVADGSVARHPVVDRLSKRLVPVVSDDTIHFIGAKEKLRKQFSYSGHFYRFLM